MNKAQRDIRRKTRVLEHAARSRQRAKDLPRSHHGHTTVSGESNSGGRTRQNRMSRADFPVVNATRQVRPYCGNCAQRVDTAPGNLAPRAARSASARLSRHDGPATAAPRLGCAIFAAPRHNKPVGVPAPDVFVLDFLNDADTIRDAFTDYYRATILAGETDPDKLHDLQTDLDAAQVYSPEQIDDFVERYLDGAERDQLGSDPRRLRGGLSERPGRGTGRWTSRARPRHSRGPTASCRASCPTPTPRGRSAPSS